MSQTIRMLSLSMTLLCLLYLTTVECRFKGKVTYTYTPKMWLKDLPDSRKLNTIAFIGTRDPPTFEPSDRILPRLLLMADKLTIGIRVFDMGVRRINNDFAMYNASFDMQAKFKTLVDNTKDFLKKNPKEFIIMIMHAESTAINSTMTDCEILRTKYIENYPKLFVQNWSLEDTVGQHRGKILLLEKSPDFVGCTTSILCTVRDQQTVYVKDDFGDQRDYVRSLQAEVLAQHSKCYLFYYTTARDVPYPPKLNMNQKLAFVQRFNEAKLPQTVDMIEYDFKHTKNSLYITVADLPTVPVVNTIIESNTK